MTTEYVPDYFKNLINSTNSPWKSIIDLWRIQFCYQHKYLPTKPSHHHTTTVFMTFFRDHSGEPEPEENFWTSWCKGRLTEADTLTIRLGSTPSGLSSAHLHHPHVFTGQMPFLPPN